MRPAFHAFDRDTTWLVRFVALTLVAFISSASWATSGSSQPAANQAAKPTTIATGSGEKYKTTVDEKPGGELSPEDFRQASLLSSRVLLHLNEAVENIQEDRLDDARAALESGLGLIKVVRDLLPSTEVTTVVRDSKGTE